MKHRVFYAWGIPCAIIALYFCGVFLLALQPLRFFHAVGPGVVPFYGTDESHYVVRLQEALLGGDASNGIISEMTSEVLGREPLRSFPRGAQPAGLEQFVGWLFRSTGLNGLQLALILTLLLAPLTIPLGYGLLRQVGASRLTSIGGALLYFFLFLGPLRRFVHQSWSLPLTMGALLALLWCWKKPDLWRAMLAGVLVGLLPWIYFWSWTFVWAGAGMLLVILALQYINVLERLPGGQVPALGYLLLAAVVALVVALPYFLQLFTLTHNPLANEVALRSSVVFAREFESIPRSVLLLFLTMAMCIVAWKKRTPENLFLAALTIGLFVAFHQQFVHGRVLSFSTHYYPYVCLVSLLLSLSLKRTCPYAGGPNLSGLKKYWAEIIVFSISPLFLLGAFLDYNARSAVFILPERMFQFAHMTPALKLLDLPPKSAVLTDLETALAIATVTDDDVVFTEHLRHVSITTEEYAERYCLSEIFGEEHLDPTWPSYILRELSAAGRAQIDAYAERNLKIGKEACARVQADIPEMLNRYGVTMILWNERTRPDWKIPENLFHLWTRGKGWSLWRRT